MKAVHNLFRRLKAAKARKAASSLAKHGAELRRETREQKQARVHRELREYVDHRKAMAHGVGWAE